MNAGIHKLTAGDGYTYLIRQTAVGDGDKGRTSRRITTPKKVRRRAFGSAAAWQV